MKGGRVNSKLPTSNSQHLKPLALGVGGWELAFDTIRSLVTTLVAVLLGSATVLACPVCFGAEESPLIDGAKLGVVVLVVITLAVQGGFVGFFLYLRKRAKNIADVELDNEWSELQRS